MTKIGSKAERIFFAYRFFHDHNEACVSHHSRFSVLMYVKRIMFLLHNLFLRSKINPKSTTENEIMTICVSFYFKIRDNYLRHGTRNTRNKYYWEITIMLRWKVMSAS